MATYLLESNESATHSHETSSTSTLLSGKADLILNGNRVQMTVNKPIEVPAQTTHTMQNTGTEVAKISCIC